MKIFIAGATGVVGRHLVPLLVADGHDVVATTRSKDKLDGLQEAGAKGVVLDALDAAAVGEAVAAAEPDAIIHQMTSLAGSQDLKHFDRTFAQTNLLRTVGTDNLVAAARAQGVRRFVAQSFGGWTYERSGSELKTEADALDPTPPRNQRKTLAAIKHLERALDEAPLDGVSLRYGIFYGPGASEEMVHLVRKRRMPIVGQGNGIWSMCHVWDAASATMAALTAPAGVYNIVDDEPAPVREIITTLAEVCGAKPPRRVPIWVGRLGAGEVGVSMLTQVRGCSNSKALKRMGWAPHYRSWRDGFREGLAAPTTPRANVNGLGEP